MASAPSAADTQRPELLQLANEDYTVGWICALTTEYVAAQVFLDYEHGQPRHTATHDNNDYTLGRVGEHNVAIAVLPGGEYGTASAAGVARDMLHTFPNIRIGLMVGIGGGAPSSRHDIRLGDVVVSEPQNGLGGVFQYDFGKNIQDQPFQSTRFLAPPPSVLLTAISGLKAKYEIDGHTIQENVKACLAAKKRLQKKYGRPDSATDRLYQSHVAHPLSEVSCLSGCGSDAPSVIVRTVRDEDEDDPVIHYGLIASANQLMKDAKLRDEFAREKEVLCFEMEAGGLMNHFPCLVIRGICDYSDTHKNKEWQGYAAMTAAAYAKDLLKRISPTKVEAEKKLSELVEDVSQAVKTTGEAVIRIESTIVKDKDNKILDWLTPISYGSQYSDLLKVRRRGTGQWFLDSAQYQTWLGTQKQTLFCPGIPGAGKTILASIVVEDLFSRFENDQEVGIAYLYCNFQRQDKQNFDDLLASLLRQLAQRRPSLPDELTTLHDKHKDKQTRPSVDEIVAGLQSVARIYSRIFIVVDALDECEKECMSKLLSQLFGLQASTTANVLATSRPIELIRKKFEGRSEIANISARDEDVEKCLDIDMKTLPLLDEENEGLTEKRKDDLKKEIKTTLIKCVDGMFLLARLHLASLSDKTTESELCTALKSLPRGQNALAQAYGLNMERIRSQQPGFRFLAEMVLILLTCAKRQLTTLELQEALAVAEGDLTLDKTKREHTSIIVSVCAGLVTVDADSGIIRLVHETTREYLASHMHCIRPQKALTIVEDPMKVDDEKNASAMAAAHKIFAIICVTYLSFSDFESGFCQTDAAFEERLQSNQLYKYAAHNWGHHTREASTGCPSVIQFLNDAPKVEASSQALMAVKSSWGSNWSQIVPRRVTGLHLASYFGVQQAVSKLLQDWQNIDQEDDVRRTPLSYAAENGYEAIIKLLLAIDKVDIDAKDSWDRTPLSYAAENGHEAVVKLLLAMDKVDVDAKDNWDRTLLSYAAENGHEAVVKLLLATDKVDVDAEDNWDRTPLSYAAENGHEAIIKLLLATDKVDVYAKDDKSRTSLLYATKNGHEAVVKLLLAMDKVDVDAEDNWDRTPLSYAAENGHEAVVKLLLATDKVDVDTKDDENRTPLSHAAENDHEAVVKLLLAMDKVDVDAKDT